MAADLKASTTIAYAAMKQVNPQFLRESQVLETLPFSRATMWRLIKARRFPAPYKVDYLRISVWNRAEVDGFLATFAAAGSDRVAS